MKKIIIISLFTLVNVFQINSSEYDRGTNRTTRKLFDPKSGQKTPVEKSICFDITSEYITPKLKFQLSSEEQNNIKKSVAQSGYYQTEKQINNTKVNLLFQRSKNLRDNFYHCIISYYK